MTGTNGFHLHAHDYRTNSTVFITNLVHDVRTVTIQMRECNIHTYDITAGEYKGEVNMTVDEFLNFVERINMIADKLKKAQELPTTSISEHSEEVLETPVKRKRGRPKKVKVENDTN